MNISDGKHIDLEDIDTIIHEEESKHNPNNDQIDTGDGDDDDDTILDNSGNIKVEDYDDKSMNFYLYYIF